MTVNSINKNNSLNTIRLLAAIQVIYGHCLTILNVPNIPVLGDVIYLFAGVPIFFTMSGFLNWQSIGRSHSYGEYLKKRFWRIFPELWVAVIVELIVMLLLYHESLDWWQVALFAITQGTVFQFWTPECLRGYGCGCPNGALWTICVLIQFYVISYFLFKWLHNKSLFRWFLCIIISVFVSSLSPFVINMLPLVVSKLFDQTILPYLWMFLVAAFLSEKKDVLLPLVIKYWWVFLIGTLFLNYSRIDISASYNVFHTIMLFFFVTGIAYKTPWLNVKIDISYGLYIYHMTVINMLIVLGFKDPRLLFPIVLFSACVLAYFSTKIVGSYSMRKKQTASI